MGGPAGAAKARTGPKVAIIGAGVAGLCTGCYAQMNGYRARIYEMHTKPGGLCTAWNRSAYTIDACVHWFTGSRPGSSLYRLWHEIGLLPGLEMVDLDEFMRVESPEGPTVVFFTDLDRLQRHLVDVAPEDTSLTKRLVADAKRMARTELPSDLPPQELMRPWDKLRMVLPLMRLIGPLGKWNDLTMAQLAERIANPHLREALLEVMMPQMSALALLMTLSWFHGRQAGYPIGGSMPVAEALERRYKELGGEIDYGARVSDILVDDDRAAGVRLADGSEQRADVVVSAADAHATIFDMLKGRYVDDTVRGWFEEYTPFPPLLLVGLGVDRAFAEEPQVVSGISLGLAEPVQIGNAAVRRLVCRIHNYDPTLAPAGKTVVTCMIPADYEYWRDLSQDRPRYENGKREVAAAVVKILDARFPGLAEQVEMVDVATPATWERYTGNWRASFEGWLPTPANLTVEMSKTLPGLRAFYMAGQWVSPGGGLPSGVMTGRQVVQLMCRRSKRRFRVTPA